MNAKNNNDKPAERTKRRGARLHKGGGYVGSSQMGADRSFGRALIAAAKKLAAQQAKAKATEAEKGATA